MVWALVYWEDSLPPPSRQACWKQSNPSQLDLDLSTDQLSFPKKRKGDERKKENGKHVEEREESWKREGEQQERWGSMVELTYGRRVRAVLILKTA